MNPSPLGMGSPRVACQDPRVPVPVLRLPRVVLVLAALLAPAALCLLARPPAVHASPSLQTGISDDGILLFDPTAPRRS